MLSVHTVLYSRPLPVSQMWDTPHSSLTAPEHWSSTQLVFAQEIGHRIDSAIQLLFHIYYHYITHRIHYLIDHIFNRNELTSQTSKSSLFSLSSLSSVSLLSSFFKLLHLFVTELMQCLAMSSNVCHRSHRNVLVNDWRLLVIDSVPLFHWYWVALCLIFRVDSH